MAAAYLKKINKIKNFGSFEDFLWPVSLPEFKKNNLFYGKNGSGKTTLSHFLQCFEEGKFPEDFAPSPSMELVTRERESSDLTILLGRIKVFNTYYISNNLFWDGGHATNLLWLGKVNIEIQNTILRLDTEIEQLGSELPNLEEASKNAMDKVDNLLIDHSKIIRNFLGYDQTKYNKTNLKKDYADIATGKLSANILSDEDYQSKRVTALAISAELEVTNCNSPKLNLKETSNSVIALLSEKITPTTKIEELMQNPELKKWVEDGLLHHPNSGECKFCKHTTLSEQRLHDLKGFFDDAQKQFLLRLKIKVGDLSQLIPRLTDHSVDKVKITSDYESENNNAVEIYKEQTESVKNSIQVLVSALQDKEQNLYAEFKDKCSEIENITWDELEENYATGIAKINEVRNKHNQHVKNFGKNKGEAQREVELHLALQQKNEYVARSNEAKKFQEQHVASALSFKSKMSERTVLKGKISSSHQAAEFINNLIKQMGHVHVRLDYDPIQQAYLLKRGGAIAKRLSEGEKTAIAFAHFVASLQQNEFNKSESIIVIDDPISSLDANASYFIYGLIKKLEKEVNQLFLMTHNYSFFILLIKHFRHKDYHGHYEVHRITNTGSEIGYSKIVEMEKRKVTYYSEYNYLFSQIYVATGDLKTGSPIEFDRFYSLMNCSRKLLEAFLGFKYPHIGKLEEKWKQASQDHQVEEAVQNATFKVINFGSHSGVDGFLTGSGLDSADMAQCVNLVLDFIQAVDSKHYNGMVLCENEIVA